MPSIRAAIIGATGYTALELAKLLVRHPRVQITAATSRQEAGLPLAAIHPWLADRCEVQVSNADPRQLAEVADVAFCCLPHGAASATVRELAAAGLRVIDLSADFRLSSPALYQQWYGDHHAWPEKLGHVVYGLPELFAGHLTEARLVANPGCYPTSAILPLAPLLKAGAIAAEGIIVDSKSGVSGAGRSPKLGTLYCEVNESVAAYSVGEHRHQPEMKDVLRRSTGVEANLLFTPHLMPMDRGILSTIYVTPQRATAADVMEIWREAYSHAPFVRVVSHLPATKFVTHTNFCDITVREAGDRLILLSALDNLIKGASGAAIQNLNCMMAWDETLGLM
jgi:N-acetyl-gamma-glutamyl-phosphate reductase